MLQKCRDRFALLLIEGIEQIGVQVSRERCGAFNDISTALRDEDPLHPAIIVRLFPAHMTLCRQSVEQAGQARPRHASALCHFGALQAVFLRQDKQDDLMRAEDSLLHFQKTVDRAKQRAVGLLQHVKDARWFWHCLLFNLELYVSTLNFL
jgi:hypothetical protein